MYAKFTGMTPYAACEGIGRAHALLAFAISLGVNSMIVCGIGADLAAPRFRCAN